MAEALRISAAVATPLALLGLIAALGYYVYALRLRFEERRLKALPPEERATIADERLSRYGIDGSNLTRDDKTRLIQDELEKRYQFARLCTLLLAVVFVICFSIAAYSFVHATQRTNDLHALQSRLRDQQSELSAIRPALLAALSRPPTPEQKALIVNLHHEVAPGNDTEAVLLDPSLTDQDKVTLLTMSIMKALDREIEEQAMLVNAAIDSPSVDVETIKLNRLIDKRSQTFDLMRQQIDDYNRNAKAILDSMQP